MATLYPSRVFLNRCFPELSSGAISLEFTVGETPLAVADIQTAKELILASCAIAFAIAMIILGFIHHFAGGMFWVTLISAVIGSVITGSYLLQEASSGKLDANTEQYLKIAGFTVFGLATIFVTVCLFLRKQLMIALEVVKEAATALLDMSSVFLVPAVPVTLTIGYFAVWCYSVMLVYSVSTVRRPKHSHFCLFRYSSRACSKSLSKLEP